MATMAAWWADKRVDVTPNGCSLSHQLLSAISASRDEGIFTDLILNHEAGRFNVHRIIVCPQSKVLHKACSGGFEETFTGVIEMMDLSYIELKKMVQFFYSMSYDDDLPKNAQPETESPFSLLQLHARMFALGDRYDIPGLRDVAVNKYSSRCTLSWEPFEFMESICDVYEGTPSSIRQLRSTVCFRIRKHLPQMLNIAAIATAYDKVLTEVPEFTKDMLAIYVTAPLYGDCSTCGPNQGFEALQVRCNRCRKGRPAP